MSATDESFVTEDPRLHTKIIRGIHHMVVDGDAVRIFTYDIVPHPDGNERRINNDLLFRRDDLIRMLGEVSELLFKSASGHIIGRVVDGLSALRGKTH